MHTIPRRRVLHLAAGACMAGTLGLAALPAQAQANDYPNKPIRVVVPYPPGGFTDMLGRIIAETMQPLVGQTVVVENKGGGGSTIGTGLVAKSAPDGYTLLVVAPDLAINESLIPGKLTYDALKDFTPVTQAAWSPMVLVTHPSLPVKSVKELIALAKAKPGAINFASGGNGTGAHLALELFKTAAGIDMLHVPYRGNGPALTALLGGEVSASFLQLAVAKPHIEAGKLRVLATPSAERLTAMPDLPTVAEAGPLPGFQVTPWFGIVAPAGTPAPIIAELNAALGKVMSDPAVRKRLSDMGAQAISTSPAAFGSFIESEIERWADVVKKSGAKME